MRKYLKGSTILTLGGHGSGKSIIHWMLPIIRAGLDAESSIIAMP